MRALILALIASAALFGTAHAAGCSGNGSQSVLTFQGWAPDHKGSVALIYHLDETKAVNLLDAHVYFASAADDILADAPLQLKAPAGLAATGGASLILPKPMARRLAAADLRAVTVFACTNYMEYADASAIIID